jgi:outer membrane protein TolC
VSIAKSAVEQTKAHQKDVRSLFAVKRATNADVARMDYQIEAANLAVIQQENLVEITEANVRLLLHTDVDAAITLGEDLESEMPPFSALLKDLRDAAIANRPELKALDAQIRAMKRQQNIVEASYYPQIAGFAHFDYSNPAMRGFQSFSQTWASTWDLGVSLTWSPNDLLTTHANAAANSSQLAALEAAREQASDALTIDVTYAFTRVREAEASVVTTRAQVSAGEESFRVAREQFLFGAATSAQLVDAESDLTRARLSSLNARADLRIALAQLKKATGQAI